MGTDYLAVVDPGKNTGVCIVKKSLTGALHWSLHSGSPQMMTRFVHDCVKYYGDTATIVGERFTFTTTKHTRQYDALEVIGALRYISGLESVNFELQGRADRMKIPRDIALRFAQPRDDDQESALRHAVVAAVRHGLIDPVTYVVRSK